MQILGITWAGRKAPADRVQHVVAKQRSDGAGGQTDNLPSDAYATREALWALRESGTAASDAVYRRGVDYLLQPTIPYFLVRFGVVPLSRRYPASFVLASNSSLGCVTAAPQPFGYFRPQTPATIYSKRPLN
jgi:hypothetical protein